MKASSLLLIASLLANGALVVALLLQTPSPSPAAVAPGTPAGAPAATVALAPGASPAQAATAATANLWSRLQTDNLDELSRRLHAAGFSARQVRAMLAMAIEDALTARREALLGKSEELPYWKYPTQAGRDPQLLAQLVKINQEARALEYKYVSGPEALADSEEYLVAAQRRFGRLPLDKLQRLAELQHDIDNLLIDESNQNRNTAPDSRMETLRAIQETHFAEVAKLLTPAELEQYELRNRAGGLRMRLATFRPTEAEFKALYAIEKQQGPEASPDQLMAQAQSVLGAERFAEYSVTMTSDGSGKLGQLLARLELPLTTITTINAVRDDIRTRANTVGSDPSLTPAQREGQLAALAREANEKLTATLGQRGYEAYVDMKGDWIRALKPKAGP